LRLRCDGLYAARFEAHGREPLGDGGVPLAAVARYLGDSVEMVMRYSHLQPQVNARAGDATMSFYNKKKERKKRTKK
jgi:hypothetical protein